jgi:DNA-binding NarL/FixJ family response regulator
MADDADADPLLVSQTGRWVAPSRCTQVTTDSRGGWNARTALGAQLGIRREEVLGQIWQAVEKAAAERRSSAVMVPGVAGMLGSLVTVRPAREPGFAVITVQHVDASPPPPPAQILAELFRFTPTEAEVALALLHGDEVSEIAATRRTSIETVRGHVKSLLRKSGLSSQKQLTAMLSRIAMLAAPAGRNKT